MSDLFEQDELDLIRKRFATPIRVFLAGPYIDVSNPPKPNVDSDAACLRYELFVRLESKYNRPPELGEHKKLQAMYQKALGKVYDAASMEFIHICEKSDVVIILPSSPGSFSEYGMFSMKDTVAKKMLVLLDETKKDPPGYVHLGTSALASQHGAEVKNVSYTDFDQVQELVDEFIETMRSIKFKRGFGIGG